MKLMPLLAGTALAMTSVWAIAQDAPESLLPPGFDRPAPPPASAPPKAAPRSAPAAPSRPAATTDGRTVSAPVVQPLPERPATQTGSVAPVAADPKARIFSLDELARMTPEELEIALDLKPKTDIPPAARRSMREVGILASDEGGLSAHALAAQDAGLVRALLSRNQGRLVSRWGHILLRRALVSRLDAPRGMNPADFAALRAALLLRMGEGAAARGLIQDVDTGNFSPLLSQTAFQSYVATADFTGMCPMLLIQGNTAKDPRWDAANSICAAFRGEGNAALSQLDRQLSRGTMPRIDLLLAQKYAGAAGKARRAVKIEWDDVKELTPWRYSLALAVGLEPPAGLMKGAKGQYDAFAATAPMLGLASRAAASDRAASWGILSSAAMVDLYSQIYAQQGMPAEWSERAGTLREAYTGSDPQARLQAIQRLWETEDETGRYARKVLTAYAAARMPPEAGLSSDAGGLIASMLAAGLDRNALRWSGVVEPGSEGWALLALAAPQGGGIDAGQVSSFFGDDDSTDARKSGFLLAGLAGLGRLSAAQVKDLSGDLDLDLVRQTKWSRMIDRAAEVDNTVLVALLAGAGMQGEDWQLMTPVHLFHIVSALRNVGLEAEARMIAAEAVARG